VRPTYVRRSDFEVRRNAEIGFFAELSTVIQFMLQVPGHQILKGLPGGFIVVEDVVDLV
jgi:hypothetical protein